MDAYTLGYLSALKCHILRGAALCKQRANWGIPGQSEEFMFGYRVYARRHCCIRREVM